MSVLEAVDRDLEDFPTRLRESALAALARTLARELDAESNSATSKSMNAKALLDTLDKLRELAPPEEKKGELHDLKSERRLRLAPGGPGS